MEKLYKKYRKLLTQFGRMEDEVLQDLLPELLEEQSFVDFVKTTKDWSFKEHDGLVRLIEPPKNSNGFYEDKYGNRVSYNGIRSLKRAKTELAGNLLEDIENEKASNDFQYFRKYYCFITTKSGLARPEPRDYQENLENELLSLEDLIILFPRQSGKTVTVATYLLWQSLFITNPINIGIVANKGSTAREVLDKIKKIFSSLPIWMMQGLEAWNKGTIEYGNGTRIMAESPSRDSFRGYTINLLYEDESAYIAGPLYQEYVDSVYPTMNSLIFKQVINSSTPRGMNHFYSLCQGATQNNKMDKPKEILIQPNEIIEIGGNGIEYSIEELYDQFTIKIARSI